MAKAVKIIGREINYVLIDEPYENLSESEKRVERLLDEGKLSFNGTSKYLEVEAVEDDEIVDFDDVLEEFQKLENPENRNGQNIIERPDLDITFVFKKEN